MNDVTDVICTLLLCKYPSIDAVYEYSVPWTVDNVGDGVLKKFEVLDGSETATGP